MLSPTLLVASVLAAPPAIDVALTQLCDARQADTELCAVRASCAVGGKPGKACAGSDLEGKAEDDDWSEWSCDVDRKNGFLTCTQKTHSRSGASSGDTFTSTWTVALFVSKARIVVGIAEDGDRPKAAFFASTNGAWTPVDPLPSLSPATFKLKEPKAPKSLQGVGFEAKFFVELTMPREGTLVTAEGRWVNAYRDDSGYGQSDTLLSREVVYLSWSATTGTFSVSR